MRDSKMQKLFIQKGHALHSRIDKVRVHNINDGFTRHGAQHSAAPCSTKIVRQAQQSLRNKRMKVTLPVLPWNNNNEEG